METKPFSPEKLTCNKLSLLGNEFNALQHAYTMHRGSYRMCVPTKTFETKKKKKKGENFKSQTYVDSTVTNVI